MPEVQPEAWPYIGEVVHVVDRWINAPDTHWYCLALCNARPLFILTRHLMPLDPPDEPKPIGVVERVAKRGDQIVADVRLL